MIMILKNACIVQGSFILFLIVWFVLHRSFILFLTVWFTCIFQTSLLCITKSSLILFKVGFF